MSTMFDVEICSVTTDTFHARFEVCHPDQWNVPSSKSFALQTVVEIYDDMKKGIGFAGEKQPITKRRAAELTDTHPRKEQIEYWQELVLGKRVEISEDEFRYIEKNGPKDERLAGFWSREGSFFKDYPPEYAKFIEEAIQAVDKVYLEDEVDNPKLTDDGPDPKATLVVMNDSSHLTHVVEGFRFSSAMWDFGDG